ncbi:MAG: hypothetical protein ACI4VF_06905 [Lachnospirales bacterium]
MIVGKDETIKIDILDENGNKKEYDVILMYDSDVTDKRYCFYTDGSKGTDGNILVRVGSVRQLAGDIVIDEITNVIEREMVSRDYQRFIEDNNK